jgi:type II secretory pathway component PulM
MSAFVETLRGRFGDLVSAMTPRDKKLFVGLVVFVYVAVLGGVFWFGRAQLRALQDTVAEREETLTMAKVLAADQAEGAEQVRTIEDELRRNATQDLPSFMEKAAQKVGVSAQLQGVREKGSTTQGTLEERSYGVELSRLSLQQLVDFLHEVETAKYPLKIRAAKVKTQTLAGQKVLNVTFEVSAFRLVEAAVETTP